jgi:hypothetical protein
MSKTVLPGLLKSLANAPAATGSATSPLAVAMALRGVALGGVGATREEIESFVGAQNEIVM